MGYRANKNLNIGKIINRNGNESQNQNQNQNQNVINSNQNQKNYNNPNLLNSDEKRNVSFLNEREKEKFKENEHFDQSNIVRINTSNSRKLIENKIRENSQNRKNDNLVSNSFLMRKKN
jgi:hypothetical protein